MKIMISKSHKLREKIKAHLGIPARALSPRPPQQGEPGTATQPSGQQSAVNTTTSNGASQLAAASMNATKTVPDLWCMALNDLTAAERTAIEPLTPASDRATTKEILDNIQEAVSKQKSLYESKKWTIELGGKTIILHDKVDLIVAWVQKFSQAVDIVVNYDPAHLALPWAGIRFLLQVMCSRLVLFSLSLYNRHPVRTHDVG